MGITLTDFRKNKPEVKRLEYSITLSDNGFTVYADGCAIIHADNIGDSHSFEVVEDRTDCEHVRSINLKLVAETSVASYINMKYQIDKVR